jgi:hypothetical protein
LLPAGRIHEGDEVGLHILAASNIDWSRNSRKRPLDGISRVAEEQHEIDLGVPGQFRLLEEGLPPSGRFRYEGPRHRIDVGCPEFYRRWRAQLVRLTGHTAHEMWAAMMVRRPYPTSREVWAAMGEDGQGWESSFAFGDLVFLDNGTSVVGPTVGARLAEQFAGWEEKAIAFAATVEEAAAWLRLYRDFRQAFDITADRGAAVIESNV